MRQRNEAEVAGVVHTYWLVVTCTKRSISSEHATLSIVTEVYLVWG